ncbi:beta-1,3-galactosyltransferase 5-like isoform X1 [Ranitomeya imitator]|uniref:beta-1,3-galactosyltransferase 5-like isoform X1 n=2 Tax=Ranitomeya imitator TaxID=111125 RepID=UPI0037E7F644
MRGTRDEPLNVGLGWATRCAILTRNSAAPTGFSSGIMSSRIVVRFHTLLFLGVFVLLSIVGLKLSFKIPVFLKMSPEPKRQSVTLDDGVHIYHLNFSRFQEEFPYLQSYRCSLLYTPQPEDLGLSPILLLAIKSHPRSTSRRAAIRETWAKQAEVMGYRLRPVFLMGLSDREQHMEIVKVEEEAYRDILLWDFTEGHHNLSLKERCFLEWLHDNPQEANFIFKGDDDLFVNPSSLVRYINENAPSPFQLHGALQRHSVVLRYSKYKISYTLFPNAKYPYFLSGGGFLFSAALVRSLYQTSLRIPVFPLDDVYLGFLCLASNLTLRHNNLFYVFGLKFDPCNYQRALVVHRVESENLLQIWNQVQEAHCLTGPNIKFWG